MPLYVQTGDYEVRIEWPTDNYLQFHVPAGSNIFDQSSTADVLLDQVSTSLSSPTYGTSAKFCHACVTGGSKPGVNTEHHLQLTKHHLQLTEHHSQLTEHHLQLTEHHLQLTKHHSQETLAGPWCLQETATVRVDATVVGGLERASIWAATKHQTLADLREAGSLASNYQACRKATSTQWASV